MIKKVNKKDILNFAKTYFPQYNENKSTFENTIVYYLNDKIIGFMTYSIIYDRAEIEYFAVKKDYRGKGISKEIYDYFEKEVSNLKNITLEVRSDNQVAINFYLKQGFKTVSTRKNYYSDIDGYLMIKKLGD